MAVNFKNNHLHVGYRMKDWHYVWYAPIFHLKAVEEPMIGLYTSSKGDENTEHSPMEGEVLWFSPFDIACFESNSNPEKKRLQKIFLYNAWRYLNEDDEAELEALEELLKQNGFGKWEAWFDHAKEWKKKQMRQRRAARRARARRNVGGDEDLFVYDGEESLTDDSAYDSPLEGEEKEATADGQRKGHKRNSEQGADDDAPNGNGSAPKKPRKTPSKPTRGRKGPSTSDFSMSGGLGSRTPQAEDDPVFRKPQFPRSEAPRTTDPGAAPGFGTWSLDGIAPGVNDRAVDANADTDRDLTNFFDNSSIFNDDDVAIEANGGIKDEDEAMNEAIRRSSVPPEGGENSG